MATVIKASQAGAVARRLGKVDFADHLREAAEILDRARAEAAKIVAEAEERGRILAMEAAERGAGEGYEKGFAEGWSVGKAEAMAEGKKEFEDRQASLAEMFQAALKALDESRLQIELEAQKNVLDFAIAVASQLTFAIGVMHTESARENLRRALSLVMDTSDVTVRCHPKDVEALRIFAESVLDSARSGRRVQLVEDDRLRAGGCIVQCEKSQVDASLETQVTEMVSILLGRKTDA